MYVGFLYAPWEWLVVPFPFVMLATFRAGLLGATAASVALALAAMWLTLDGHGLIAAQTSDLVHHVHSVQFYILLSAVPVAIVLVQREFFASKLRDALQAGMDLCVGKPIEWPQLFAAMARLAGEAPTGHEEGPMLNSITAESSSQAPLLDRDAIDRILSDLPADSRASFLRRALHTAEIINEQLQQLPVGSPEFLQQLHKVKGTSGALGLKRISEVAEEIEIAVRDRRDASELLNRLSAAVSDTGSELRRSGLVGE